MKRMRKIVAVTLAAVLIYGAFGNCLYGVFAADTPAVTIKTEKYENGTLSVSWISPAGAKSAVISYHKPAADDTALPAEQIIVPEGNKAGISGLKADYIYDISIAVYNGDVDAGGNPVAGAELIGRGLLFCLPSITFSSTPAPQEAEQISSGGGYQIGHKPGLKLYWKEPKVFYDPEGTLYPAVDSNPGNNEFRKANDSIALQYMQNQLNGIYNKNIELSTLNYIINISTDVNKLNAGPDQTSVLVDQQGGGYKASLSGRPDVGPAEVTAASDMPGFIGFELLGRADEESSVTTPSGVNVLPDEDILPGTVYYMNIKPIFKDAGGENVYAVSVGDPSDMNGSILSGERPYTSTPIRFQLTRDSANNIYVKIYKINQGSLYLPRLYYEVQVTDDHTLPGDWPVKKTMDDSYFSGATAITVITGVNPNNELYYRIVVKSDNPEDRLESLPLPYTLTIDTSRPPLPTGITITDRIPDTAKAVDPSGAEITVKSSDIVISWDKPLNWDTTNKEDLYFHFLLNTNQTEIASDVPLYADGRYWESYPAKYRLVKYVCAGSENIKEQGNRLTYTLKAFELFKPDGAPAGDTIPNDDGYPEFLMPNTVYYLQMYTTTKENRGTADPGKMSDRSIIVSFTTLSGAAADVPLPVDFKLSANGKQTDTTAVPPVNYNYVDLKFDKVTDIDWRSYAEEYDTTKYSYEIYYDIFMSMRTDPASFIRAGTTEIPGGDVAFTGADDIQSTSVAARISRFTEQSLVSRFGNRLLPNTTYYFKARTRLVVRNKSDGTEVLTKTSMDTAILPVTTIVTEVNPPDDSSRKPMAPTDFSIALDENQNPLVSGNSVTFTWERQEEDVIYELIRTSRKVNPNDPKDAYENDPEYISFLEEYDALSDGENNGKVYLDPVLPAGQTSYPEGFSYDHATGMCTYTVDRRIFPNKLYYFSLKAVRVDAAREPLSAEAESVWVSIPVTTSLIEAPSSLEVVVNAELGFSWTDATAGLTAEDYRIYAKGPDDIDYRLMQKTQSTIVKDGDGRTYYGRISGLKINSSYDVKVTKENNVTVYEKNGLMTRDGYHELEVRWMGKPLDSFSRYDIVLMAEGDSDYTTLTASDLEQYTDKNGSVLPYYAEETAMTVNSDSIYYYARIKSAEMSLPGGITAHRPLRSNVKYYIKVRSVKVDSTDASFIAYSKYIGPVDTRTEFNQDDYDDGDREEDEKARFYDRIAELEKEYYWRVDAGSGIACILLKGDRVSDALANTPGDSFTIDMTSISANLARDEIYVPLNVIKTMNSLNKSVSIRTAGSVMMIRPETLEASENEQLKNIAARQGVKDIYIRLSVSRSTSAEPALPSNYERLSDINELVIQATGLTKTDGDLKKLFHNKLYSEDTGLVGEKLDMLLKTYVGSGTGSSELIDQYIQSLIDMIKEELSEYIGSTLKSVKLSNTTRDIKELEAPISAGLSFKEGSGIKIPYVLYDGSQSWQKISAGVVRSGSAVTFNLAKTGKYVILSAQGSIGDIPAGHWAEDYIKSLTSQYDLSGVFTGINKSFMPDNLVTCREVVLLYEKVTGRDAEDNGLDIRQKSARLGLDVYINPNSLMKNISRQETAGVLIKLFSVKKGVSADRLEPGGILYIEDEGDIGDKYYKPVLMAVDMEVMSVDGEGRFNPGKNMTRAEVVAGFVKMLRQAGEVT